MGKALPRLPLDARLDITYRCNNRCRHCWLWLPPDAPEATAELSFDELRRIIDEARRMGCQAWGISGGEPMLRPDFGDILDYISRRALRYRLNTNGTLITPALAQLLTRPGNKMVALYGATAQVHDDVTRNPGSFEAMLRGCAYLKEAGAAFVVQIVPMRANYHQYDEMVALAASLSPEYRVGAPWLWLSANQSPARNREIAEQRLDPATVLSLDPPDPSAGLLHAARCGTGDECFSCGAAPGDDRLFAACIEGRRDFHIDPYGQMSFCCFVKDPALRYDLRKGTFEEAWEHFIPSLKDAVRGGPEYQAGCGSCELRADCRVCPVYAYLEHDRYSAKVDYLCDVAQEVRRYKQEWRKTHLRYYRIAGITIQLTADFEINDSTYQDKFAKFRVDGPGDDTVALNLVAAVPTRADLQLGKQVYRRTPWDIYRQGQSWVYLVVATDDADAEPEIAAVFNADHTEATVYTRADVIARGDLGSLTTFTSDQVWLAQLLADREGCYMHSSGIIMDGKGLLFVGHSEAGKSTMLKILGGQGELLCDDRVIVRRGPDGFRIHGSWSHGELPDVSPNSAPLRAILYLDKAPTNELIPIESRKERFSTALNYVVRPMVTADWWDKILTLTDRMAAEVPAYRLRFDKSGAVADLLKTL